MREPTTKANGQGASSACRLFLHRLTLPAAFFAPRERVGAKLANAPQKHHAKKAAPTPELTPSSLGATQTRCHHPRADTDYITSRVSTFTELIHTSTSPGARYPHTCHPIRSYIFRPWCSLTRARHQPRPSPCRPLVIKTTAFNPPSAHSHLPSCPSDTSYLLPSVHTSSYLVFSQFGSKYARRRLPIAPARQLSCRPAHQPGN